MTFLVLLPERLNRPMPGPWTFDADQLRLELAADEIGPVDAFAHEAHATLGKRFDRRHADLRSQAVGQRFALGHGELHCPAHKPAPALPCSTLRAASSTR